MAESRDTELTYRYERWRAVSNGILEMAGSTFLLLIAVRILQAGPLAKSLIAGGGSAGLLLSPLTVWWVSRSRMPAAQAASRMAALGAMAFLVMAAWPVLPVFVAGCVISMAAASTCIPLMTQIYQENYPVGDRGRLFSRSVMIRIGTAALFSELAGRGMAAAGKFQWLLLTFSIAFAASSYSLSRIPSRPLRNEGGWNPFHAMRFVREDRMFRRTLICWMLMGFANLMMLPLRVEYLGNPVYKQHLDVTTIALLVGVIPNVVRLVLSPVWGWLFDRMNFFALRVILNIGFALGILAFFTSNSMDGLLVGSIIYGISGAGGDVAWSLWVTKFAPPEHVADYMSVHTFFTGLRGVTAPVLAFHFAAIWPLSWLAAACITMIVVASLMLLPELQWGKRGQKGQAMVEDVAD